MMTSARWFSRIACGLLALACADGTDPTAPGAASTDAPQLATEGETGPTEADFASMPAEFRTAASIYAYSTDVGFNPAAQRAYAVGHMTYLATNATQSVNLSLRFDDRVIASNEAVGENSDWLPAARVLYTTAYVGVSGACGHLAEATTTHRAWHQFLVGGWKFLSWSNNARSSYDSEEQSACEPPPPPPPPTSGGNPEEYESGCELCQQWFYVIDYRIVDEWWECSSIPEYYCQGAMT
jgi:hypothetical protein